MKEEGGGGGRAGAKGVALQMSSATYRYPGIMGLFPWPPEKGGMELSPTRTEIRVLCQEEVISLQSSAQAEAQIPASRTGRQEK